MFKLDGLDPHELSLLEIGRQLSNPDSELLKIIASGYSHLENDSPFRLSESFFSIYLAIAFQVFIYAYALGIRSGRH